MRYRQKLWWKAHIDTGIEIYILTYNNIFFTDAIQSTWNLIQPLFVASRGNFVH